MKIELKISTDAIVVLSKLMAGVYTSRPITTAEKVSKCVMMDVSDKVTTKVKALQRKQTLFDNKKKVSLSLKYSQGYYLYLFLQDINEFENAFQQLQAQKIINLLDQKLS